jgi:hypothetical protein
VCRSDGVLRRSDRPRERLRPSGAHQGGLRRGERGARYRLEVAANPCLFSRKSAFQSCLLLLFFLKIAAVCNPLAIPNPMEHVVSGRHRVLAQRISTSALFTFSSPVATSASSCVMVRARCFWVGTCWTSSRTTERPGQRLSPGPVPKREPCSRRSLRDHAIFCLCRGAARADEGASGWPGLPRSLFVQS